MLEHSFSLLVGKLEQTLDPASEKLADGLALLELLFLA